MRAIILLAIIGASGAVPKSTTRIVGGSPTTVETYPYMANMQFQWWGVMWRQACGGSLLTQRTIVSAAHCFSGDRPEQWRVLLGTSLVSSGGTLHTVRELVQHPQYLDETVDNDIAIVRLSILAVYSSSIQPARIAGTNYNVPDGTVVTAVGWGDLSHGGDSPLQLQHVDVNIINQQLCVERYAFLKTQPGFANLPDVTDNMICTGILDAGGKDTCQGDSGGPIAHQRDILVGITSWAYRCADPYYPGVKTRVSRFANWIVTNA